MSIGDGVGFGGFVVEPNRERNRGPDLPIRAHRLRQALRDRLREGVRELDDSRPRSPVDEEAEVATSL